MWVRRSRSTSQAVRSPGGAKMNSGWVRQQSLPGGQDDGEGLKRLRVDDFSQCLDSHLDHLSCKGLGLHVHCSSDIIWTLLHTGVESHLAGVALVTLAVLAIAAPARSRPASSKSNPRSCRYYPFACPAPGAFGLGRPCPTTFRFAAIIKASAYSTPISLTPLRYS